MIRSLLDNLRRALVLGSSQIRRTTMLLLLVAVCCLGFTTSTSIGEHKRSQTCYAQVGCFNNGPPFISLQRPLNFHPKSPTDLNIKFLLYTKQTSKNVEYLRTGSDVAVNATHFDPNRQTKVLVHGYIDTGNAIWLHQMKDAFLLHYDYNIIIVDWGRGSAPPYTQATANTRTVGAYIAVLINYISKVNGAKPEDFHIIGHSLGAHVAGYAGERLRYLGRITGMDPAEPFFQNTPTVVRLDPTDALFVDVMHTDGQSILKLGYGMKQPCGHVDYFPNGGMKQPGCDKDPITQIQLGGVVEGVKQFVACNHLRSHALFTESINSQCPFEGYKCNSYDDFNNGNCMPCSGEGCGYMGLHANRTKPSNHQVNVKYFLKTGGDPPFCRYHYQVKIFIGQPSGSRVESGYPYITLIGSQGQTAEVKLSDDLMDITPGQTLPFVMTSEYNLGDIRQVIFKWSHSSHWYKPIDWNILGLLRTPKVYVSRAEVTNGEASRTFRFCEHNLAVPSNVQQRILHGC